MMVFPANYNIIEEGQKLKDIDIVSVKRLKSIGTPPNNPERRDSTQPRKELIKPLKQHVKDFPFKSSLEVSKYLETLAPTLRVTKSGIGKDIQVYTKELERKARIQEQLNKIDDVHRRVGEEGLVDYDESFCYRAEDDILTLAEIGLEDLNEESRRMLQLKEQAKEEERERNRKQYHDLKLLKAEAKDELYHREELMKRQMDRLEQESISLTNEKSARIKTAFLRIKKTLKGYLSEEKHETERIYKELSIVDREDVSKLRKGSRSRPQIVKIRLQVARCLKDKLPKGRYAILITILDRIGGSPLKFENKDEYTWRKVSAPRTHSGEHSLSNLRFEKTIHLVAPSRRNVSSSMVYLFELFLLRSKEYTYDQVLGWGVFPLCNSDFELNLGRFKVSF